MADVDEIVQGQAPFMTLSDGEGVERYKIFLEATNQSSATGGQLYSLRVEETVQAPPGP